MVDAFSFINVLQTRTSAFLLLFLYARNEKCTKIQPKKKEKCKFFALTHNWKEVISFTLYNFGISQKGVFFFNFGVNFIFKKKLLLASFFIHIECDDP